MYTDAAAAGKIKECQKQKEEENFEDCSTSVDDTLVINTWSRKHCIDPVQAKENDKKAKKARKKLEKKRLKQLTKSISLLPHSSSKKESSLSPKKVTKYEPPLVRIRQLNNNTSSTTQSNNQTSSADLTKAGYKAKKREKKQKKDRKRRLKALRKIREF